MERADVLRSIRRPRFALFTAAILLITVVVAFGLARWARSSERDVRCDKTRRADLKAQGKDYSCLIQIPGHDRGH